MSSQQPSKQESSQQLSKRELLNAIRKLKEDPNDRLGILGDIGIAGVGAVAGGAAAAVFGASVASIPVVTALTGIGVVVAAPVALVAGSAIAVGAGAYGLAQLLKDGSFNDGKRRRLLEEYEDKLHEVERLERSAKVSDRDKNDLYILLEEPIRYGLIEPEAAQQLIQAVETGEMPISEAYKLVRDVLSEVDTQTKSSPSHQSSKKVLTCPCCSQALRAPTDRGRLNLTCPKCQHSWQWEP